MLGYGEDRVHVYGFAFSGLALPADRMKGIGEDNRFQLFDGGFGYATSDILRAVLQLINNANQSRYKQVHNWLNHAQSSWHLIDKYSVEFTHFANMKEFQVEKKVKA